MTAIRLIPCLDIQHGRVVKGRNFVDLKDNGDPVETGKKYNDEGADELVFLDISASHEGRPFVVDLAEKVAEQIFIPFTVGGGINTVDDVRECLLSGADKVAMNSAAIRNPKLISQSAEVFGSQAVVVAIDAKRNREEGGWTVFSHGGRASTGLDAIEWAKEVAERGAGELLVTSIDGDGTRMGYDLELTRTISDAVGCPVIASGGAGNALHLIDGVVKGHADAVLLAGILHDGTTTIGNLKRAMDAAGLSVRYKKNPAPGESEGGVSFE
ncbi:MAG: imidazole glycerol phosphate synthase subunit HisF [Armatimonadetes bacterium]|nr:imidazole glycerol phosphate synthase subunit HisF [Armatimonadota bacterium]